MRSLIAIAAILILAVSLIKPNFTASDVLGMAVVVPFLTAALYGLFGALGVK